MVFQRACTSFFLLVLSIFSLAAQSSELIELGGPLLINLESTLPAVLTSTRSAVVVSLNPEPGIFKQRANWKVFGENLHKTFRKIGIDAVVYVYQEDLDAGPEITRAYHQVLSERKVRNIIYVRQDGMAPDELYSVYITSFSPESFLSPDQPVWKESHNDLDRIHLRLGRQVLRQELERSNFLIPESPEFLDDVIIYPGTRLENFPSRLKGLPLAVTKFEKAAIPETNDPDVLQLAEAYNEEIDRMNQELDELMALYPFQYKLVDYSDVQKLYSAGYQYVLLPVCSSAKNVKRILNYQTSETETDYMTVHFMADGKRELRKIPVNARVCKYYIKQTIVGDIHVGGHWDAAATWQDGLSNYLLHLKAAFP